MHRIEPCAPYLPRRASDTNKYDYGRVLCAHAALRCGAGLVSVGVPEAIYAITAVKNDAAMPFPLPSADGKLMADALSELLERLRRSDVCVLGPGLGRNAALTALVQAVVLRSETPLVLDADALFAVAQDVTVLDRARAPIVLTPHDGEFARLAGADAAGRGGVRFCRCARLHRCAQRAGDGLCVPGRGHGRAARRQSRYGQGRQR